MKRRLVFAWDQGLEGQEIDWKWAQKKLLGDGNVLYPDCVDGYMGMNICHNLHCTYKMYAIGEGYVKLCFKKIDFFKKNRDLKVFLFARIIMKGKSKVIVLNQND